MTSPFDFLEEETINTLEAQLPKELQFTGCEAIQNKLKPHLPSSDEANPGDSRPPEVPENAPSPTIRLPKTNRQEAKKPVKTRTVFSSKQKKRFLAAFAALLTLVFGTVAGAAGGLWHLPAPSSYQGEAFKTLETSLYTASDPEQETASASPKSQEETGTVHSDEWFLKQAQSIVKIITSRNIDTSRMKLAVIQDELWDRKEVEISFPLETDYLTTISFDQESGTLLSIGQSQTGSYSFASSTDSPDSDPDKALQTAQSWYQKLPYPQGYTFTDLSRIDEHAWMYSFSRTLQVSIQGKSRKLTSDYEQVRITIDPTNGSLLYCNAFYVPLLDDHQSGQTPLSQEEAWTIIRQRDLMPSSQDSSVENLETSAKLSICLPNYQYSNYETDENGAFPANLRYSKTCRLAWICTFSWTTSAGKNSPAWEHQTQIYVDLYTGEILGGDSTK